MYTDLIISYNHLPNTYDIVTKGLSCALSRYSHQSMILTKNNVASFHGHKSVHCLLHFTPIQHNERHSRTPHHDSLHQRDRGRVFEDFHTSPRQSKRHDGMFIYPSLPWALRLPSRFTYASTAQHSVIHSVPIVIASPRGRTSAPDRISDVLHPFATSHSI